MLNNYLSSSYFNFTPRFLRLMRQIDRLISKGMSNIDINSLYWEKADTLKTSIFQVNGLVTYQSFPHLVSWKLRLWTTHPLHCF